MIYIKKKETMKHIFHRYKKAWYALNDIQEIGKIVNASNAYFRSHKLEDTSHLDMQNSRNNLY